MIDDGIPLSKVDLCSQRIHNPFIVHIPNRIRWRERDGIDIGNIPLIPPGNGEIWAKNIILAVFARRCTIRGYGAVVGVVVWVALGLEGGTDVDLVAAAAGLAVGVLSRRVDGVRVGFDTVRVVDGELRPVGNLLLGVNQPVYDAD